MKTRFSRWVTPTMALAVAGFALLGTAPDAGATLILESTQVGFNFDPNPLGPVVYTELFVDQNAFGAPGTIIFFQGIPVILGADSNPLVPGSLVVAGPGGAGTPIQVGSFLITGNASQSNSPGTPTDPTIETLTSSSLNVLNNSAATASTIVTISDNNYTPLAGGQMTSTAAGTVIGAGGLTVTTVDSGSNELNGGTSYNPGAGPNLYGFNQTPFVGNFAAATGPTLIPFTLTMAKSIEFDLTLAPGASLNGRTNGITNYGPLSGPGPGVPEPATLVMAFSTLPLIGFAAWRKRRRSA